MNDTAPGEVTVLLNRLQGGDKQAEGELITCVYRELKTLAAAYMKRERSDHTLQPTALVNEAYLRLTGQKTVAWQDRAHFFAVAARVMRRILVDYARNRLAQKRGAGADAISLDEAFIFTAGRSGELLALDEALDRLAEQDRRTHRVIELRFFGGLSVEETAEVLEISSRTVKREWSFGRAWLRGELDQRAEQDADAVGAG